MAEHGEWFLVNIAEEQIRRGVLKIILTSAQTIYQD